MLDPVRSVARHPPFSQAGGYVEGRPEPNNFQCQTRSHGPSIVDVEQRLRPITFGGHHR